MLSFTSPSRVRMYGCVCTAYVCVDEVVVPWPQIAQEIVSKKLLWKASGDSCHLRGRTLNCGLSPGPQSTARLWCAVATSAPGGFSSTTPCSSFQSLLCHNRFSTCTQALASSCFAARSLLAFFPQAFQQQTSLMPTRIHPERCLPVRLVLLPGCLGQLRRPPAPVG